MKVNKWFSERILRWYSANKRDLPWRNTNDPYKIWLSEIILQQTRVDQGISYYHHFITKYPTVKHLAIADQEDVLKSWEGLGYYSRARNLHASAQHVYNELNGEFPTTYIELIKLKGVGPYTAAAISSICSGESNAVVDGNVYRVLSRAFGITEPIDSTLGKKVFQSLANELIDPNHVGEYNQAIMEFGATHCTPKNPSCRTCIFVDKCICLSTGKVDQLPIKKGKTKIRERYFEYFAFSGDGNTFVEKRLQNDIWQGLFQFPMLEFDSRPSVSQINSKMIEIFGMKAEIELASNNIKHILSHQKVHARIWKVNISPASHEPPDTWTTIAEESVEDYAMPRLLTRWLENQKSGQDS